MKLKIACALVISMQSFGALATPVTLTSKVKSISLVGRPGVDYGGVQILLESPITGTACATADVARGFIIHPERQHRVPSSYRLW